MLVARPSAHLDSALKAARRVNPAAQAKPVDVGDHAGVKDMVAGVVAELGRVDVLINSAAVEPIAAVADATIDDIEKTVQTNLLGTVYCTKEVLATMLAQREGCVVMLSSTAARFPLPRGATYCATKAAVAAFGESLYLELRGTGVQVLVVYPGFVAETDMAQAHIRARGTPPRIAHQSLAQVSAAIRGAIGTRRFQLVLPRHLAWAPVVKDLFPAMALHQVARTQA